nr:hypothetical protein BaRGS_028188 [Batillaria attramentaria]
MSCSLDTHVVHVANPENMAFQNSLYNEMNRTNSQIDRQNTPVPPTPTTPSDEFFYPTKPGKLPDEELGAVGGAPNPYTDIGDGYMEPTKVVLDAKKGTSETQQKTPGGGYALDTRTEAGASESQVAGVNHYSDFEELKRRSIAARQNSSPNAYDTAGDGVSDPEALQRLQEEEEAHHYHDLDDVFLQIHGGDASVAFSPTAAAALPDDLPAPTPPEDLDTTDEEDEGAVSQEDIDALRREVLQERANPESQA